MDRGCGIYMPILKLQSNYGFGSFSKETYDFIDFLSEHNIKYWQIDELSIKESSSDKSSLSAFALDPIYLDIEKLLVSEEIEFFALDKCNDYDDYKVKKSELLRYVFDKLYYSTNIDKFISDNEYWVYDYAVYLALKEELGVTYEKFPLHYKNLDSKETISFIKSHSEEIIYHIFLQYLTIKQWKEVKKYANSKGVKIISKISEMCSNDSSDLYSKPKYFKFDSILNGSNLTLNDIVFAKDNNQGEDVSLENDSEYENSLLAYNMEAMKKDRYEWWIERLGFISKIYDFMIIENNVYEFSYKNDENQTEKYRVEKFSPFNLDMLVWIKNNAIKNIILDNVGNNLDREEYLKSKINYPYIVSLNEIYSSDSDNSESAKDKINIIGELNKNTMLYFNRDFVSLKSCLKNESFKENLCYHLNLNYSDYNDESSNDNILKIALENMLSSNANLCIVSMKDIMSFEDDLQVSKNKTEDKEEANVQLNYQSEKYFEYLKQLVASKNR